MSLLTETFIISAGMIGVSAIPLYSATLRQFSSLFYLLGTGALSGILAFDLLPDLFELGGQKSMWAVGVVWVIYSLTHFYHMRKHHEDAASPHAHAHQQESSVFFLLSMISHCFASGILLVTSDSFSSGLNRSIFFALLAHKLYESLTVSSVLLEKQKSKKKTIFSIALYAVSLPLGVLLTYAFRNHLTPTIALLAMSLASGTLLGCLIFDFFLPSFFQIRKNAKALIWITVGLLSAQVFMRAL